MNKEQTKVTNAVINTIVSQRNNSLLTDDDIRDLLLKLVSTSFTAGQASSYKSY